MTKNHSAYPPIGGTSRTQARCSGEDEVIWSTRSQIRAFAKASKWGLRLCGEDCEDPKNRQLWQSRERASFGGMLRDRTQRKGVQFVEGNWERGRYLWGVFKDV
ncbi:hypothetical protein Cni_G20718 [Canna indica]|uniref:Uncharacterized protein n=1 Tax=Canna indica TaxID=4628 RepID=A0AAQ3QI09_9LILI|nr:hypothetical protein Cni_G20718 [Canna indica]